MIVSLPTHYNSKPVACYSKRDGKMLAVYSSYAAAATVVDPSSYCNQGTAQAIAAACRNNGDHECLGYIWKAIDNDLLIVSESEVHTPAAQNQGVQQPVQQPAQHPAHLLEQAAVGETAATQAPVRPASKAVCGAGETFGYYTVMEHTQWMAPDGSEYVMCRCRCGNERVASSAKLISGEVTNCGCMDNASLLDPVKKQADKITDCQLRIMYGNMANSVTQQELAAEQAGTSQSRQAAMMENQQC